MTVLDAMNIIRWNAVRSAPEHCIGRRESHVGLSANTARGSRRMPCPRVPNAAATVEERRFERRVKQLQ
jgi:hypothetical protein